MDQLDRLGVQLNTGVLPWHNVLSFGRIALVEAFPLVQHLSLSIGFDMYAYLVIVDQMASEGA